MFYAMWGAFLLLLNVQLACKICRLCSAQEKLGASPYKRGCTVTGESQNFSLAG